MVQGWFEGLWTWIGQAAKDAVSVVSGWVWSAAYWIRYRIEDFSKWVVESLLPAIRGVVDPIISAIRTSLALTVSNLGYVLGAILDQVNKIGGQLAGAFSDIGSWLGTQFTNALSWLLEETRTIINGAIIGIQTLIGWLYTNISSSVVQAGRWVITEVSAAFDGASSVIGDVIKTVFGPISTGLSAFIGILEGLPAADFLPGLLNTWRSINSSFADTIRVYSSPRSVVSPSEAWSRAQTLISEVTAGFWSQVGINIAAEALSLGQVDIALNQLFQAPGVAAVRRAVDMAYDVLWEGSLISSLRYYFLEAFTPTLPDVETAKRMVWRGALSMEELRQITAWQGYAPKFQTGFIELTKEIPGPGDLIRFVVREVITPSDFVEWMMKQGYSSMWAWYFWDAHWVLPAFTQIVDAFHRGILTREERDKYIVWHDFSPRARPGIAKSDLEILAGLEKTLIPRVDLRRGWELGRISDEELVERYEWLGYEEDSPLMAEIQKAVALDAEIADIRKAWISDFQSGLITEAQLRANLGALKIVGARQDYYVYAARIRRERALLLQKVDLYEDGYNKDLITEEELRIRLLEILVDPVEVDMIIDRAHVRKYVKPKPPQETTVDKAAQEVMKYQVAYLIELYRKYAIEKDDLVLALITAGVDPDVASARADYEELKRPIPKPPAEEIEKAKEAAKIQTLNVKAAITKFKEYLIDEEGLYLELMAAGLSEALAMANVQLEALKRPPLE